MGAGLEVLGLRARGVDGHTAAVPWVAGGCPVGPVYGRCDAAAREVVRVETAIRGRLLARGANARGKGLAGNGNFPHQLPCCPAARRIQRPSRAPTHRRSAWPAGRPRSLSRRRRSTTAATPRHLPVGATVRRCHAVVRSHARRPHVAGHAQAPLWPASEFVFQSKPAASLADRHHRRRERCASRRMRRATLALGAGLGLSPDCRAAAARHITRDNCREGAVDNYRFD